MPDGRAMFGHETDVWVGRRYGPYEIEELLGRGSVAHVYRASTSDRGDVALKVLTPFAEARSEIRGLFEQEFELMARFEHPNIMGAHRAGVIASTHFMEIELVDGETVLDRLTPSLRMNEAEAISITQQMCSALDHVHSKRVIHRDVKPSNIMLTADRALLFDFGLSLDLDGPPSPPGRVYGSPQYLAPEQAIAGQIDHRTDFYGLGVTLFRMVTGALPFNGERNDLLQGHVRLTPPDPREVGTTADLADIILTAMQKDPDERFQSGADFAAALATVDPAPGPEPSTKRRGLLGRRHSRERSGS